MSLLAGSTGTSAPDGDDSFMVPVRSNKPYHSDPPTYYLGTQSFHDSFNYMSEDTDGFRAQNKAKEGLRKLLRESLQFKAGSEQGQDNLLVILAVRDFVNENWILTQYLNRLKSVDVAREMLENLQVWFTHFGLRDFQNNPELKKKYLEVVKKIGAKFSPLEDHAQNLAEEFVLSFQPKQLSETTPEIVDEVRVKLQDVSFNADNHARFKVGICAKLIDSLFVYEFLKVQPLDVFYFTEAWERWKSRQDRLQDLYSGYELWKKFLTFVQVSILQGRSPHERGTRISGFIDIATFLDSIFRNYEAAYAIVMALESRAIKNLQYSWSIMQKEYGMKKIIMHESLREKYSINRGYARLKKEMRVAEARYYRCVPCMAAVRKAILDTRIRHKKLTENENLNIARYDKILSWINMINTFQDTAIRTQLQNCDPPIQDEEILSNVLSQIDANILEDSEVKSIGKEVRFRENEESGDLSWLYIFIVAALVSIENISNIFLAFFFFRNGDWYWFAFCCTSLMVTYIAQLVHVWNTDYIGNRRNHVMSRQISSLNHEYAGTYRRSGTLWGKFCEMALIIPGLSIARSANRIYANNEEYFLDEDVEDANSVQSEFARLHVTHAVFQSLIFGSLKLYIMLNEGPSYILFDYVAISFGFSLVNIAIRGANMVRMWQSLFIRTAKDKTLLLFLIFAMLLFDYFYRTIGLALIFVKSKIRGSIFVGITILWECIYVLFDYHQVRKQEHSEQRELQHSFSEHRFSIATIFDRTDNLESSITCWDFVLLLIKASVLGMSTLPNLSRDPSEFWFIEHCVRYILCAYLLYEYYMKNQRNNYDTYVWYAVVASGGLAVFFSTCFAYELKEFMIDFRKGTFYNFFCCGRSMRNGMVSRFNRPFAALSQPLLGSGSRVQTGEDDLSMTHDNVWLRETLPKGFGTWRHISE